MSSYHRPQTLRTIDSTFGDWIGVVKTYRTVLQHLGARDLAPKVALEKLDFRPSKCGITADFLENLSRKG